MLSGAANLVKFGESLTWVDICKIWFYICRVVRNSSWIAKRFESSLLPDWETQFLRPSSYVNKQLNDKMRKGKMSHEVRIPIPGLIAT